MTFRVLLPGAIVILTLCFDSTVVPGAENATDQIKPVLEPNQALLKQIKELEVNTWLKLPRPKVIGDLEWTKAMNWKSMLQVGPYGRDFSNKMAWMPDRKRALFAGGGHNVRPLNDVWEYDLAANTWVCLYGADRPAQRVKPEWIKSNLVLKDGVLMTKRGGPPRLSHSFDGWNYDSERRVAFMPESLRGAVFVDHKAVAEGLGMTAEELKTKWKPAPYLLTFDPYACKWGFITENVPKCGRDPSARYISHLKGYWVSSSVMALYDPEKKTSKVLSKKGGGGGYASSTAYDPDTKSVVVIVPKSKKGPAKTWIYYFDTDTWKTAQPDAPVGGRSSSGYFDYDSTAKCCVLYNASAQEKFWVYDPKANDWTAVKTKGAQPVGGAVIGYYDPARDVVVHYNNKGVWVCRLKKVAETENEAGK